MPALKGLEWTFDTVASTYEKLRPGYVEELYQTLFEYIPINENSNVVEVGSGGGQATAPILKTGCRLTAVEYEKVFSMLKNGGVFARFANHPFRDKGNPALSEEIDEIYDEYYYKYYNKNRELLLEYTEEQAKDRAMIATKYGFTDIQYALFYRKRVFSAKEYIELLGTYSDHIAIEEKIREKFFSKIEEAINNHGGTITIYDTIDLQLARKV